MSQASSGKKPRCEWTDDMTRYVITLFVQENEKGAASDNGFKAQGWSHIHDEFTNKFPNAAVDTIQIQSKYKALKTDYKAFERLSNTSGFNIDSSGRVVAAGNVWDDFLSVPKNKDECGKFRCKPLKYAEDLQKLFSANIAHGDDSTAGAAVALLGPTRDPAKKADINTNSGGRKRRTNNTDELLQQLVDRNPHPLELFERALKKFKTTHASRVSDLDAWSIRKSFIKNDHWCDLYLLTDDDDAINLMFADAVGRKNFKMRASAAPGTVAGTRSTETPDSLSSDEVIASETEFEPSESEMMSQIIISDTCT
jgi:hypothetical protein